MKPNTSKEMLNEKDAKRLELFERLYTLSDAIRVNYTEILNAAKTVNLVNSYNDKTIQMLYEVIRQRCIKEGITPEETVSYKVYEELEINNNIQGRYCHDIVKTAEELAKQLEDLEAIANEI